MAHHAIPGLVFVKIWVLIGSDCGWWFHCSYAVIRRNSSSDSRAMSCSWKSARGQPGEKEELQPMDA